MKNALKVYSIHWRWLTLFGLWLLFLSGFFANFLGSPGVLQSIRLQNLLQMKRKQLSQVQDELKKLQIESSLFDSNRNIQEREVRRVLGYAANDEIIFDFSDPEL